jgi:prolyl oligopeptidase
LTVSSSNSADPLSWLRQLSLDPGRAVDEVGTVRFADPYRALEDESSAVQAWQSLMNARTDAALALDGLDALADELAAYLAASTVPLPWTSAGVWLWPTVSPEGTVVGLRRSASSGGSLTPLVRAADLRGTPNAVVDWAVPSSDGLLVAVGTSAFGDEQTHLDIVDTVSGERVGVTVPHVHDVAWWAGDARLFLAMGRARDTEQPLKRPAVMTAGERPEWLDAPGDACDPRLRLQVSADGRFLGLLSSAAHPRLLYVQRLATSEWTPVRTLGEEHLFAGDFVGGRYYAVTTADADRGQLVSVAVKDLGHPVEPDVVVPESAAVLRSVAHAGADRLVLSVIEDGRASVRVCDLDGRPIATLPGREGVLAGEDRFHGRVAAAMPACVDGESVVVATSSTTSSPALIRYELDSEVTTVVQPPLIDLPEVAHEVHEAAAPDGHRVRLECFRRPDVSPGAPTLLAGYGGFNVASCPQEFLGIFAPWVAAGGTYVFAHVRGDGTFGVDQWRAGRRGNKEGSFADFIAVAEHLVATGESVPASLAICGSSNGGLLVAGALVRRPELFRAAAVLVPIADLARLARERVPEGFREEYGDARIESEARWLASYSPYHQVRAGRAYPRTLIVSGERDVRTHAWHGRKLAAALASGTDEPDGVLLRVHADCGHTTAAEAGARRIAEWLGYLMAQVGLSLSERPSAWTVAAARGARAA